MKSIARILSTVSVIFLLPLSIVVGQEKKTEQKIKIIVDDGSGKKVVLDTLFSDGQIRDSITLKDGKTIFIGHLEKNEDIADNENNEHVYVNVSDDGRETRKVVKRITVVSSDSSGAATRGDNDDIYVFDESETIEGTPGLQEKHFSWMDSDDNGSGDKVIVINDKKILKHRDGETIRYKIRSEDGRSDSERTKYVITKNGMVITVEGSDYDKVKNLVKEIEGKLDAKKDGTETSKQPKEVQKNAVKKK
jgi:hypothetical protein